MKQTINQVNEWVKSHLKIVLIALLAFMLVLPLLVQDDFYRGIIAKTLLYMLLGTALNITNGYGGQFNLGFAGFMCVGAYTSAICMTKLGLSFIPAMVIAGCVAAVFGMLLSLLTARLSGMYLSLVTLGFAEIIRIICLNFRALTGGAMGIKNIPVPTVFGYEFSGTIKLYYVILTLLVVSIFCCYRIVNSRVGRAWIAIRENPDAASSLGVNLVKYKALNFATSAFFAAVAGTFMSSYYRFINSDMFTLDAGHEVLVMVVLGGMGTFVGPVLGAAVINFLLEVFRFASTYRMLIYSVMIITVMWLKPQGIAGAKNSMLASRRATNKKKTKKVKAGGETK